MMSFGGEKKKLFIYAALLFWVIVVFAAKLELRAKVDEVRKCEQAKAMYSGYIGAAKDRTSRGGEDGLFLQQMTAFAHSTGFEQCLEQSQQIVFRKYLIMRGVQEPGWGGDGRLYTPADYSEVLPLLDNDEPNLLKLK